MRDLWFALNDYAQDHDGELPVRLEELHPDYMDLRGIRCPMWRGKGDALETGYEYIPGQKLDRESNEPILFCKSYHINGHNFLMTWPVIGLDRYCAQFSILTSGYTIIHARTRDLRKYNGPARRRYLAFLKYPYDGSEPTLELVRSLEEEFPDEFAGSRYSIWIDE